MKHKSLVIFLMLLSFFASNVSAEKGGKLKLWYDKPATVWNEALPIGNGRISAMVFGDPANEKLQLNESTFWSGGPSDNDNPLAKESLTEVRKLIFDEKYREADKLANQTMTAKKLHGSKFQILGNLNLAFPVTTTVTDYYRELDIQNALFTVTYTNEGVLYKREVFSSIPDQVIVMRLTASKPGKITFTAGFDGPLSKSSSAIDANTLEMTGLSGDHEGVTGQVKFDARAKIINKGGKVSTKEGKIEVTKANEVVIMISMATNFVDYKTLTANEVERCIGYLANAHKKAYPVMLKNHIKTFRSYFDRVSFDLGTSEAANKPTDVRIKNFSKSNDPSLVSMYFQFGRYLLISSSQPGGQPANLQGIWNGSPNPAWDSKYTININTEMNYWPAEKCNMTEMHEPLVKMIKELSETGSKTAKNMYGCDGWVAHHNTDIWRICGVVDFANAGLWPMGGAWLSQHLWEKFLYNGDLKYLESVYPVMLSACKFYKDFLCEEPTNKWLVVSPSVSPENTPQGHPSALSAGTTMDNQLVFDLFSKTIKAAKLLNKDKNLAEEFKTIIERLPPMQVGKYGQLQEWIGDWDNPNDKHRHVSHLYGLYPGNQINPYTTPELFDAARTSLIQRGDVSTGWSMGWKVNLWARLLDGNHAFKLITDQLTLVDPVRSGNNGGTYPNFFDAHPPFQIDGNFGCTAGIAEMLMQCQNGAIHLLPALPDAWSNGSITGLRAIGGFEVSFTWENNKVKSISIKSNNGGNCRLRLPNKTVFIGDKVLASAKGDNMNQFYDVPNVKKPLVSSLAKMNEVKIPDTYVFDFETDKGKTYLINTTK